MLNGRSSAVGQHLAKSLRRKVAQTAPLSGSAKEIEGRRFKITPSSRTRAGPTWVRMEVCCAGTALLIPPCSSVSAPAPDAHSCEAGCLSGGPPRRTG